MAAAHTAGPALDLTADLTVEIEGETVEVRGYGDLVVVDAPSLAALRRLRGGLGQLPIDLFPAVGSAGVDVDVRVRGTSVARVDPDRDAGLLGRLLGIAPVRPSVGGVVRSLLRR